MNEFMPPTSQQTTPPIETVSIVGAGSIGLAWAIVFATAGVRVRMYETVGSTRDAALGQIEAKLSYLDSADLLAEPSGTVIRRITVHEDLAESLLGASYVQECVVEDLAVKRELFAELDRLTAPHVVLASSTSTIMASSFAADLPGKQRCLVVHPGNPPYILRVAEVVPAEFTSPEAIEATRSFLLQVAMRPIMLTREVEGFAFNRLQGALLREAFCLVRDGVISPLDIDTLVREGLGLRWSLIGPFTTSELNTRGGLRRHSALLGSVYARLGNERSNENPWTDETVERVADEIERNLPYATWEENVRERDRALIQLSSILARFKNPLNANAPS